MRHSGTQWTREEDELLIKARGEGWSFAVIARDYSKELGGKSRNALIGRSHRLGIQVPLVPKPRAVKKKKPAQPKPKKSVETVQPEMDDDVPDMQPIGVAVQKIVRRVRGGVTDLDANQCRWIHGDTKTPDYHFCVEDKQDGSSYCPEHHKKAHQKVIPFEDKLAWANKNPQTRAAKEIFAIDRARHAAGVS